ncbi:hypothetical protein B0O99DRAFT_736716 [Bisporella sp. PMI_857]|nr:hypothetical protein B0O99DRAFT_736716 [Bisporella sp. PMI_857]
MPLPDTIKKWVISQDGLDNMKQTTVPLEVPWPGEGYITITRHLEVQHLLLCLAQTSVTIVASNSSSWRVGDRVLSIFNQTHLTGQVKAYHMGSGLGLPLPGCLMQYKVFPETGIVKAPQYLTDEEASTLPIAGVTAWMAINGMRRLGHPGGKGETVLIQGTGGVSINGLQIAKASGAEVIITSSSDAKLEQSRKLGVDKAINYLTNPDWEEEALKLTNDQGADIIFENGGAQTLRKSFESVAFGGLINCIGYLSGKQDAPDDRINTTVLALKRNVTLKGLLNGPRERFEEMMKFYEEKEIKPVVDMVFSFGDSKEALKYLFAGGHFGKVVIKVD